MIMTDWWCNNHLEKYEFANGEDDIPYMKWKKNVPNHQPGEVIVKHNSNHSMLNLSDVSVIYLPFFLRLPWP